MKLSKEMIEDINKKIRKECYSQNQGLFKEPYGIPDSEKRLVVYMRYEAGGVSGGCCWDDSDPQPYTVLDPDNSFIALDVILKELKPDISYLDYKGVEKLIKSNEQTQWEYYGNSVDYVIKYIVFDELIKKLGL